MVALRPARTDEWQSVAQITNIANSEYAKNAIPEFWQRYEESTRSFLLSETGVLRFVASVDDEIVGSVVYCPPYERQLGERIITNRYPEMRLLSVLPNFRNKGIANYLIDACEGQAKVENAEAITLHTTSLMAVARAMYERRGYSRYSEIDFEPVPGFTVLGYIKKLTRGEYQNEQR